MRPVPQAEVSEAAQPTALDLCGFREDQTRAPGRKRSEVNEMEGRGAPWLGAVLRHRRDDDAVGQGDAAKGQRHEEQAHQGKLRPRTPMFFMADAPPNGSVGCDLCTAQTDTFHRLLD